MRPATTCSANEQKTPFTLHQHTSSHSSERHPMRRASGFEKIIPQRSSLTSRNSPPLYLLPPHMQAAVTHTTLPYPYSPASFPSAYPHPFMISPFAVWPVQPPGPGPGVLETTGFACSPFGYSSLPPLQQAYSTLSYGPSHLQTFPSQPMIPLAHPARGFQCVQMLGNGNSEGGKVFVQEPATKPMRHSSFPPPLPPSPPSASSSFCSLSSLAATQTAENLPAFTPSLSPAFYQMGVPPLFTQHPLLLTIICE